VDLARVLEALGMRAQAMDQLALVLEREPAHPRARERGRSPGRRGADPRAALDPGLGRAESEARVDRPTVVASRGRDGAAHEAHSSTEEYQMARGTVKWFNDQKTTASSPRRRGKSCSSTTRRSGPGFRTLRRRAGRFEIRTGERGRKRRRSSLARSRRALQARVREPGRRRASGVHASPASRCGRTVAVPAPNGPRRDPMFQSWPARLPRRGRNR
jgi:hypothetical protein